MGHIHKNPGEHDFTASAYIVRTGEAEPEILLHQHKILGHLLQVGGHVEVLENLWAAMMREIPEETGYELDQLTVLQPEDAITELTGVVVHPNPLVILTHEFPGKTLHFHTDIAFAFLTDELPNGAPQQGESKSLNWFNLEGLNKLEDHELPRNVKEIGVHLLTRLFRTWQSVPIRTYRTESTSVTE